MIVIEYDFTYIWSFYSYSLISFFFLSIVKGIPATRPVIEMTIPTSVDKTIAPEGEEKLDGNKLVGIREQEMIEIDS